ncbi:MAG: efflux RND transporter periplasmic adaptor subunit [Bacillota bacterium]|jgi:HlyD family secretion protein|nr:efflux RND transporter periplasmic adaptor subunit [Bacillota bacterium]
MQKSILPERLREQQKKRRKTDSNRQLSLIIFTALAIGLIAYGAYYFFLPKQEKFVLGFYTYAQVDTRDFLETLSVQGTVVPKNVEIISAKIGGTLEEILVEEGQDVAQGDPLFRLYSAEVVAEKNAAETELGEARAKLAQLEMDQEIELAAERMKILDAREQLAAAEEQLKLQEILFEYGSIAKVDLEKAEQSVDAAERRLAQSERELELLTRRHEANRAAAEKAIAIAEEKLAKALENMEHFTVTAPSSGRILSLKIPSNRIVTAHQELGTLADLTEQVAELNVAPGQTERFGLGSPVTISLGQSEYSGVVAFVAPRAEQGTDGSRVLVRVEFLEEVTHLRPYSSVMAHIHLQLQKDSLYLPRGAYLTSGQQLFVYVIDGNKAQKREVQFGLLDGNAVQILRGLELGERVIISSYDAFRHLDEIEILPEGGHAL